MGDFLTLALGNPGWSGAPPRWDFRPFIVVLVALPVLRLWLGLRLRPIVWLVAVAVAPVFTGIGDAIGFSLLVPMLLLPVATAGLVLRTRSRRRPAGGV
jgi:hypothetical protein